jgi:hypothetical protein
MAIGTRFWRGSIPNHWCARQDLGLLGLGRQPMKSFVTYIHSGSPRARDCGDDASQRIHVARVDNLRRRM